MKMMKNSEDDGKLVRVNDTDNIGITMKSGRKPPYVRYLN
jgi:hypothetical protein